VGTVKSEEEIEADVVQILDVPETVLLAYLKPPSGF